MKPTPNPQAEKARIAGPPNSNYGLFILKSGVFKLRCIVSVGLGWDHVSVSLPNRCPTWTEMDLVKDTFFSPTETPPGHPTSQRARAEPNPVDDLSSPCCTPSKTLSGSSPHPGPRVTSV
jgi:hypothetical protein